MPSSSDRWARGLSSRPGNVRLARPGGTRVGSGAFEQPFPTRYSVGRPTVCGALLASVFAFGSATVHAQTNFGQSAAIADDQVLIGQPANFYGPGIVYVYTSTSSGWVEQARLASPDSAHGVAFGAAMATDGERLLVGAPASRGEPGSVHLFRRDTGSAGWSLVASATGDGPAQSGSFGASVALTATGALVSAPGVNGSGAVFPVELGSSITVGEPLDAPTSDRGAQFGASVSVHGDLALIGAPGANGGQGAAYLYRRAGAGTWQLDATLTSNDEELGDGRLGSAVLLTEGRAYAGAPLGNGAAGTVLVFETAANEWSQTGQLHPLDGGSRGRFGSTLASSGDELWVGAPTSTGGDGTAYRFVADGNGGWSSADAIQADSANTAAWPFGFGTSIAASEAAVAIGMPRRDFGEGRASVLTPSGDGWQIESTVMGEIFTAVPGAMEGLECEDGKIAAFDCSNMELVSYTPVSALGGARGVWVNDVWGWTDPETGRNYALVARRDGAAFVDVSNTASPRLVGSLLRTDGSRPSVWRDIKVYADHAFIVSDGAGAHGMQVFDLTRLRSVEGEPVTFTADAHYDGIYSAHNVVANPESGFLYIVGSNGGGETCGGGLHIIDARTPKEPTFAGCYTDATGANARGYTHDAHCVIYDGPDERYRGREICVAANEVEVNIADVTDKSAPTPIGRSSYPNAAYAHQGWLDEDHRYFYMGDEADEVQGSVAGTRTLVWDLSELDDPILVREYIGPVQATDHNLFINGDRAYMSNYGSGLRVVDITNRENPQEVAYFDSAPMGDNEAGMSSTSSGAWSNYPFFEDGLVIFTSVREGLFIMRVKPTPLVP